MNLNQKKYLLFHSKDVGTLIYNFVIERNGSNSIFHLFCSFAIVTTCCGLKILFIFVDQLVLAGLTTDIRIQR